MYEQKHKGCIMQPQCNTMKNVKESRQRSNYQVWRMLKSAPKTLIKHAKQVNFH